ncbi:bifunctional lysylphosphatidylglycerol flippase/synthetase MprF [Amnibacterium endophyticum]|uniref:Bifunctional lysylphosphatidylglycerol flippase/synthetase MprF n=1 Tax=Amnibacterium endophyticum TaxID=2109337 RepID=A0ABW4LG75_9MICO
MRRWARDRAVGIALAAVTLVVAVATRSLLGPDAGTRQAFGLSVRALVEEGRVGTLLGSLLLASGPVELILVLAALVLVVGGFERLVGHGRVLGLWLLTGIGGGLLGVGLEAAGLLARGVWTTPPITLATLQPETPVLGVLLAGSAWCGPLWRRRIRLIGLTALVVLLLYSGQPEDLDHLAGAFVGLVAGAVMTRRSARPVFPRSSSHESRTLLAAGIAVSAVGPFIAAVQPRGYGLLRPLGRLFHDPLPFAAGVRERCAADPTAARCLEAARLAHLNGPGPLLLSVLPLLVLLVAAAAVLQGRAVGAWAATAVGGLLAVLGAVYYGLLPVLGDPDQVQDLRAAVTVQSVLAVLVPLAVAVASFLGRRWCGVLPTRRALVVGGASVVAAAGIGIGAWLLVGLLVRGQFHPTPTAAQLLLDLPQRFVPTGFLRFRRPEIVPVGPVADLLSGGIGAAFWTVLLVAVAGVALSVRRTTTPRDQERLRALLREGSNGSIGWMTTWAGNRTWFSPDGAHAIAYRDAGGVALTVGEPAGPAEGADDAARAFALHCDDRGLIPAFYAVRPEFAAALGGPGAAWATVEVGEDTIIDPGAFTMRGKHWQDVRSSFNRADRAGVRAMWTDWASLPLVQRTRIEAISEEWVAERRLPELGFTLGGQAELEDPEVRLMLAVGPGDRVEAVTSWLPTWRDGELVGLTLDFMRRDPVSMNGVMEFLIASVIGIAQQRGLEFVSLSVAPLSGVDEQGEDRVERLLAVIARRLEPAYGFRSLAAYKEKFKPEHRTQVLAVPDAVALPAVTVAVARAYLPEPVLRGARRIVDALRPEAPAAAGADR